MIGSIKYLSGNNGFMVIFLPILCPIIIVFL